MVKFDEKGQGYWDFILANCNPEMIEAIQEDLESDTIEPGKIISVTQIDDTISVIISFFGYYVIHRQTKYREHVRDVVFCKQIQVINDYEKGLLK